MGEKVIENINPFEYTKIMHWIVIKNFENYEVSDNGLVRNIKTQRILKQTIKKKRSRYGYALVYLYNKNGRSIKSVHRLVAEAFIPNPLNLPQINHKDENSLNNKVDNLEWCSAKYNMNYGTLPERRRAMQNWWEGKHHTIESREKMRLKKIGVPSKRKRKVVINGIEYESVANAMSQLHLSTRALYRLLKSEKEGD